MTTFRRFCCDDVFLLTHTLVGKSYDESLSLFFDQRDSLKIAEAPGGALDLCIGKYTKLRCCFDEVNEKSEQKTAESPERQEDQLTAESSDRQEEEAESSARQEEEAESSARQEEAESSARQEEAAHRVPSFMEKLLIPPKENPKEKEVMVPLKEEHHSSDIDLIEPEIRDWTSVPLFPCEVPEFYYFDNKLDPSLLAIKDGNGLTAEESRNLRVTVIRPKNFITGLFPEDYNTLFVDGAYRPEHCEAGGRGGMGGLFRDPRGGCLWYFIGVSSILRNSAFHETESVLEGLKFAAKENPFEKLVVFTDSETICRAIDKAINYAQWRKDVAAKKDTATTSDVAAVADGAEKDVAAKKDTATTSDVAAVADGAEKGWTSVKAKTVRKTSKLLISEIVEIVKKYWSPDTINFRPIGREGNYPADLLSRLGTGRGIIFRKLGEAKFSILFLEYLMGRDMGQCAGEIIDYYLKYANSYLFMIRKMERLEAMCQPRGV